MRRPTNWDELPLMLSVKETAKITGYGQARIRELCRAGIIPNIRLGRAYRIPREALRGWIMQQAQGPRSLTIRRAK